MSDQNINTNMTSMVDFMKAYVGITNGDTIIVKATLEPTTSHFAVNYTETYYAALPADELTNDLTNGVKVAYMHDNSNTCRHIQIQKIFTKQTDNDELLDVLAPKLQKQFQKEAYLKAQKDLIINFLRRYQPHLALKPGTAGLFYFIVPLFLNSKFNRKKRLI